LEETDLFTDLLCVNRS